MSPQEGPSITVVICTHSSDRFDDLSAGLAGLGAQSLPPLETLVVVDRNPTLEDRVRDAWPDLTVLTNQGTGGIADGRNTAIAAARGDVVAFLDDDAVPDPGWLEGLAAPYADPHVQVVGGWVSPAWDHGRPRHLPRELDWLVGCAHDTRPATAVDVRNPIGASLSLRRDLVDRVGGFSELLSRRGGRPLGCDETEFSIRVVQQVPGARVVLEPRAEVHHRVSAERTTWAYLRSRSFAEGLSKAVVARLVGAGDATSEERRYATRVLPAAFAREVAHGRFSAAAAIVTALAWTGWGYLVGRLRR